MSQPSLWESVRAVRRRHEAKHAAQVAFLAPRMRQLARDYGWLGVTVGDLRDAAMRHGWLPTMGRGRELSWLVAVPRAAGLVATHRMRMCSNPDSRNSHRVFVHPDYAVGQ